MKIRINNDPKRQIWWDKECHELKRELKKAKKKSAKNEDELQNFYIIKRNYRLLIEKKKEVQKMNEWAEAKKDKTGRKFWNLINRQRGEKTRISERIKMEEWVEHFKVQMNGTEINDAQERNENNKKQGRERNRRRRRNKQCRNQEYYKQNRKKESSR